MGPAPFVIAATGIVGGAILSR